MDTINDDDKKKQIANILDPLSVIIKLAILSKKDIGCKICIQNNIINIQEPGIFQSLVRYIFKNNKIDISYLYNPIQLACVHFLNPEFVKNNTKIKSLFLNAQKGLTNLIETYKNFTIITHTLYMYYNIIANHLGEQYNDKLFIRDNISEMYTTDIVIKLYSIWVSGKIKMILDMIEFIDQDINSEKSIKCLNEFMILIDQQVVQILN